MYFSIKGEYGMMAMLELGLADQESPLQAKTIAEHQGISIKFLEHILRSLRHAGLVESVRGIHGGYRLAKPSSEILLGDVIQAVDGPIALGNRPARTRNGNGHMPSHSALIHGVWEGVKKSVLDALNKTTLSDLCQQATALQEQRALMYHI